MLQYLGYCRDVGFHASKLQNDMKSSQCMFHIQDDIPTGLACSAAAVKTFNELEKVVDKLWDDYGKGFTWAKLQKGKL